MTTLIDWPQGTCLPERHLPHKEEIYLVCLATHCTYSGIWNSLKMTQVTITVRIKKVNFGCPFEVSFFVCLERHGGVWSWSNNIPGGQSGSHEDLI